MGEVKWEILFLISAQYLFRLKGGNPSPSDLECTLETAGSVRWIPLRYTAR